MFVIIGLFFVIGLGLYFEFSSRVKRKELLETVTNSYRGTKTERSLVLKLLKYGISAEDIFHDLYVEKSSGNFSQIDLVVITEVGIIVFEVKDYSGWIFGKGNQYKWTKVLSYGKIKHRFYNPVMQNNGHITVLRKKLKQSENIPLYSVIVFYGNCRFRDISQIPQGTFLIYSDNVLNIIDTIISDNLPIIYSDKVEIMRLLNEAVQNGEYTNISVQHIENIREMLGK